MTALMSVGNVDWHTTNLDHTYFLLNATQLQV